MNTWRKVGCCLAVAAVAAFGAFGGTTLFVDGKSQGAAEPYGTPDTAATTITAAMTYVGTLGDEAFPVEIRVAEGKYTETGFTLDKAIAVVGMTGDPKDVEIVDAVAGKRAFTITHAEALVKDLTISGGGLRIQKGEGGHIYMTAGTVEHCVIRDGVAGWTTNSSYELGSGGNVFMTGGKLVRCQVLNGTTSAAAKGWTNFGGGVHAVNALVDSCLFVGNGVLNAGATCGGAIYASGSTVVANCTVVDNKPAANGGGGIYVNSADVKVVNTVFFNNGGDLAKEIGPSRHDQFFHCASSVTNEDCATWQLMAREDFVGYQVQDFRLSQVSPLVDAGSKDADWYPSAATDTDLFGGARTSGSAIDLGCHEIDQSALSACGYPSTYLAFENTNVTFTAKALQATDSVTYEWDFGNGETREAEGAVMSYAYPEAGFFTVKVRASDDGGANRSAWMELPQKITVVPAEMFVDSKSANPVYPYRTRETAAKTIAAALLAATNTVSAGLAYSDRLNPTIRLCAGTITETGMTLAYGVRIVGDTGDPAGVAIVANVSGRRAFTITHAEALVKDLTISGGGLRLAKGEGGHIRMTAGTVEHCVIRDGVAGWATNSGYELGSGGNVYMTGGKLVRCQVLNGTTSAAAKGWTNYGGGVHAVNALVDSCLFVGNGVLNAGATCGGAIYASGSTVVANCTVVDNKPAANGGGGIYVNSADVKVVNTVFFNNGGDLAKEIGPSRHDQFFHCASSVTNEDCATWQVMSEADFAGYSAQDFHLSASSSLVDAGTTASDEYPIEIPEFDLDGSGRVSGAAIDLGCYEIDQSVLTVSGNTSVYGSFEGSNIVFSASAKGGSGVFVFRWDFGNNVIRDTEDAEILYAYPDSGLYQVRLAASDDGGSNWSDWVDLPTKVVVSPDVMFVDSACETPVFPYKTRGTAAKTIKAALNALTNNISSGYAYTDGAVIRVCKGTHAETDMTLACGVQIVGDTGNPADVVILDNVYYKRAFKIDAAGAVLKDLTISGGGLRIHDSNNAAFGGHVAMSAGTVENCVIRDGRAGHEINSSYSSGRGGNVYMTGGRLVRCQILNGRASETSWLGGYGSSGEGVYASGGVIENCLFSGNGTLNGGLCSGGAILAAGNAAVINCTVVDNKSPANGGGGIYVAGASVRVVNSVFFNNGGDMKSEIGLVNGDCFSCCASSVDNEACATWQVIDESAFRNWSRREEGLKFLVPRTGKPLVGTGTDADGYAAAGGTSSVDLLGKNRQFGKRLDIGCLESQAGGTLIFVR